MSGKDLFIVFLSYLFSLLFSPIFCLVFIYSSSSSLAPLLLLLLLLPPSLSPPLSLYMCVLTYLAIVVNMIMYPVKLHLISQARIPHCPHTFRQWFRKNSFFTCQMLVSTRRCLLGRVFVRRPCPWNVSTPILPSYYFDGTRESHFISEGHPDK